MSSSEYVYLLQEIGFDGEPTGLYKIGQTSVGVDDRKRQYKAGNPRELRTAGSIMVGDAQIVETALHRRFDRYRLKGYNGGDEWFNFAELNIDKVFDIVNEYGDFGSVTRSQPKQVDRTWAWSVVGVLALSLAAIVTFQQCSPKPVHQIRQDQRSR